MNKLIAVIISLLGLASTSCDKEDDTIVPMYGAPASVYQVKQAVVDNSIQNTSITKKDENA